MTSRALTTWRSERAARLDRLEVAHAAVGTLDALASAMDTALCDHVATAVQHEAMVRRTEMRKFPRVGDRVIAPFGLSEVEGEVIYISYTFDPPAVTIEFKFDEYDTELHTMVYSADQLRPADMVAT